MLAFVSHAVLPAIDFLLTVAAAATKSLSNLTLMG